MLIDAFDTLIILALKPKVTLALEDYTKRVC